MTDARIAYPASFDHRFFADALRDIWAAGLEAMRSFPGTAWRMLQVRARQEKIFVAPHYMEMRAPAAQSKDASGDAVLEADAMQRFHRTIVPHMDSAYNFARFLSRDPDAAQDILQDAFLRACRSFEGYRGGDPRAWIFSIVRNCYHAWLLECRRKARFEVPIGQDSADEDRPPAAYDIASDGDTPEMAMIHTTESLRVRQVIGSLSETMREVLVLRELEDLSYRQIADIIDVPIGTVMSRLARARREFGDAWRLLEEGEVAE